MKHIVIFTVICLVTGNSPKTLQPSLSVTTDEYLGLAGTIMILTCQMKAPIDEIFNPTWLNGTEPLLRRDAYLTIKTFKGEGIVSIVIDLTFNATIWDDSQIFYCSAQRSSTADKNLPLLRAGTLVRVTSPPECNIHYEIIESVPTLVCTSQENSKNFLFSWKVDGSNVSNNNSNLFNIKSVAEGKFACFVSSSAGDGNCSITMPLPESVNNELH